MRNVPITDEFKTQKIAELSNYNIKTEVNENGKYVFSELERGLI